MLKTLPQVGEWYLSFYGRSHLSLLFLLKTTGKQIKDLIDVDSDNGLCNLSATIYIQRTSSSILVARTHCNNIEIKQLRILVKLHCQ